MTVKVNRQDKKKSFFFRKTKLLTGFGEAGGWRIGRAPARGGYQR